VSIGKGWLRSSGDSHAPISTTIRRIAIASARMRAGEASRSLMLGVRNMYSSRDIAPPLVIVECGPKQQAYVDKKCDHQERESRIALVHFGKISTSEQCSVPDDAVG
jgi:hypothetical protein